MKHIKNNKADKATHHSKIERYAKVHNKTYITESDLRSLFPYDAVTGWQELNTAKIFWWRSQFRKPS